MWRIFSDSQKNTLQVNFFVEYLKFQGTLRITKRTYHWPKDAEAYHLFRSPLVYVTTLCRLESGQPGFGKRGMQQEGLSPPPDDMAGDRLVKRCGLQGFGL